ncbi:hypothetical protein AB751O23_BG_00050, partial [Chlamydiales bacterium SCGC AB-751-O23]
NKKSPDRRLKSLFQIASLISFDLEYFINLKKPIGLDNELLFLKLLEALKSLFFKESPKVLEDSLFSFVLFKEKAKSLFQELDVLPEEKSTLGFKGSDKSNSIKLHSYSYLPLEEEGKQNWKSFALQAQVEKKEIIILDILTALKNRHILEDYFNHNLKPLMKKMKTTCGSENFNDKESPSFKSIYQKILQDYQDLLLEEKKFDLLKKENSCLRWEKKINLWKDPALFPTLFNNFQKDFLVNFNSLKLSEKTGLLSKKRQIKLYIQMVETFDKSIKSLKMSPQYKTSPNLLLKNLKIFLKPFLVSMIIRLKQIPASSSLWNKFKSKKQVIDKINTAFIILERKKEVEQLNSTPGFSVDAARLGSVCKFKFAFESFLERDRLSLEDLFSLIHQNLLASILHFNKNILMNVSLAPKLLTPLSSLLKKYQNPLNLKLLDMEQEGHTLKFFYNSPQNEHSFNLNISYDNETENATLNIKLFGRNFHNRISRLITELILEKEAFQLPYSFKIPLEGPLKEKWSEHSPQEVNLTWNLTKEHLRNSNFLETYIIKLFLRHIKNLPTLYFRSSRYLIKEIEERYIKLKKKPLNTKKLIKKSEKELKRYGPCLEIAREGLAGIKELNSLK